MPRTPNFGSRVFLQLLFALVLLGPLAALANAQFGRQLPSPVAASQFEAMLRDAGLPESVKDAALPMHEAYFERFREFEKREVDPALASQGDSFRMNQSVDDARREMEMRRRLFQRAGQLDSQLVDEVIAVVPERYSWMIERVRGALARRRAAGMAPPFGPGARGLEYTLRSAPVLAEIDRDSVNIVQTGLDAYEAELTRLLARYSEASLARIVRSAEVREEMGLGAPPEPSAEGDIDEAAQQAWFERMSEAQRRAGEEVAQASQRIRRHQRDGLNSVMPLMRPHEARAMRNHMLSAVYPMIRTKAEFDGVFEIARKMRSDGDLDRSRWESVQSLAEANEVAVRPLINELMELSDEQALSAPPGLIVLGSSEPDPESPDAAKMRRVREQLTAADERDTAALRALLGIAQPAPADRDAVAREGIDLSNILGGQVEIEGGAIVVGAVGGGDMVMISGDELGDAMSFSFAGATSRAPKPMDRSELDALARATGFEKDTRPIFDEIVARAAEARNAAEKEHGTPTPSFGASEGGMSFTIQVSGSEGGAVIGADDNTKLLEAIDGIEERMFDELQAVAAQDRNPAVEKARRARARVRLLPGESGDQAVDLVKVVEAAALDDAMRARVQSELDGWDENSVATIRSMRAEVQALEKERERLFADATSETVEEGPDGSTQVSRAVAFDGEIAERLEKVERSMSQSRARVADMNRNALRAMTDLLADNASATTALRRAYLRAANPGTYRMARDLEPFFTKARGIEGVSPEGMAAIEGLRTEWIESRESRIETHLEQRNDGGPGSLLGGDPAEGIQRMQAAARERKRLRDDLEQIEATSFRRLAELLLTEVGAERAKELGELPTRRRPGPVIQFGG